MLQLVLCYLCGLEQYASILGLSEATSPRLASLTSVVLLQDNQLICDPPNDVSYVLYHFEMSR